MNDNDILIIIFLISFLIEYVDATIGMGYGTALTPILLIMGFNLLQIVPAILTSQFFTGVFAAILHHRAGNVNFDFHNDHENEIKKRLGKFGYIPKSLASKITTILMISSIIGIFIGTLTVLIIPDFYFKLYVGVLVVVIGIIVITRYKSEKKFSWKKILGLGILASFNKGMSGGGYGPIIVSGQILSGIETKNSIGISLMAKGITSLIGVMTYFILRTQIDWKLAPFLVVGAMISVPISIRTVKKTKTDEFTLFIGFATLILGILTLIKVLSYYI